MITLKFKLLREGKTVGYEKHRYYDSGSVIIFHSVDGENWGNIKYSEHFIPHDDKKKNTHNII